LCTTSCWTQAARAAASTSSSSGGGRARSCCCSRMGSTSSSRGSVRLQTALARQQTASSRCWLRHSRQCPRSCRRVHVCVCVCVCAAVRVSGRAVQTRHTHMHVCVGQWPGRILLGQRLRVCAHTAPPHLVMRARARVSRPAGQHGPVAACDRGPAAAARQQGRRDPQRGAGLPRQPALQAGKGCACQRPPRARGALAGSAVRAARAGLRAAGAAGAPTRCCAAALSPCPHDTHGHAPHTTCPPPPHTHTHAHTRQMRWASWTARTRARTRGSR
jgi:hypothetical protein